MAANDPVGPLTDYEKMKLNSNCIDYRSNEQTEDVPGIFLKSLELCSKAEVTLSNRGAANSQIFDGMYTTNASGMHFENTTSAYDTSSITTYVNFEAQNGASTDTCILEQAMVILWP